MLYLRKKIQENKLKILSEIGKKIKNFLEKKDHTVSIDSELFHGVHPILEESYSICDNERYFHIVHKISQTYMCDGNYTRLMEDVESWINETPDKECREGLIILKSKLEF